MCDVYQLPSPALYLLQPDQNFLMKVKVEDLEGLLTQKHSVIVMKVKVEDLEGLGGQSRAGQSRAEDRALIWLGEGREYSCR